jgi:hypothetical protein
MSTQLNHIGSNQTVLTLTNGTRILYSYSTPVAAYVIGRGYLRTDQHYSATTSKHINVWLDGAEYEIVTQAEIDSLVP